MDKKVFGLKKSNTTFAKFLLRKQVKQERSSTFSSGQDEINSWLDIREASESFEYFGDEDGSIGEIQFSFDQIEQDVIISQSHSTEEYLSLLGSQLFLLWIFLDLLLNYVDYKQIYKEIVLRLLPPTEVEQLLLQPLINKAKQNIALMKLKAINNMGEVSNRDDEKKDLMSINTDNFFRMENANQQQCENMTYTNNIQFIPNYSIFELQKLLQSTKQQQQLFSQQIFNESVRLSQIQNNIQNQIVSALNASQNYVLKNGTVSQVLGQHGYQSNSCMITSNGVIQNPKESAYKGMSQLNQNLKVSQVQSSSNQIPLASTKSNPPENIHKKEEIQLINQSNFSSTDNIGNAGSHRESPQSEQNIMKQSKRNEFSRPESMTFIRKISQKQQQIKKLTSDQAESSKINIPKFNPTTSNFHPRNKVHSFFAQEKNLSHKIKSLHQLPLLLSQSNNIQEINAPLSDIRRVSPMNNIKDVRSSFNFKGDGEESLNHTQRNFNQDNQFIKIEMPENDMNQIQFIRTKSILEDHEAANQGNPKSKAQLEQVIEVAEKEPDNEQSTNQNLHHNHKRRITLDEVDFEYFKFLERDNFLQSQFPSSNTSLNENNYLLLTQLNPARILDLLFEFDRLKSIILDSSQKQLFEYITQSPINKHEYFFEQQKRNSHHTLPSRSSIHCSDSTCNNPPYKAKEKIIQGWKAMKIIEEKKQKSEIDIRLINSINSNLYCLINSSNLEEVLSSEVSSQKHAEQEPVSKIEPEEVSFQQRERGGGEAVQFPRARNISDSSCIKIIPDENFNF